MKRDELRGIIDDLATQVNRALPMAEELRQLRHSVDLVRLEVQTMGRELAALTEVVAAFRADLQSHASDERIHAWLAGDNGG